MMNHDAKAKFLLALHKQTLQHFDAGGTVLGGPTGGGTVQSAVNPNSGAMGSIGNTLGLNNNFQAGAANIQAGTNAAQLNNAYSGAQGGLSGQQAFANQAAAQGGFSNQANTFAQQQALASQLQAQARGEGPNPAQAALNQETGRNVANQAALMASQRGSSANPGLVARQAAMQGAAIQQQAVGQGSTLQAQQQLAAQSALANQQAQMQGVAGNQIAAQGQGATNLSSAQQNEQNILQGANTTYNNAGVSMQGNINNANAAVAAANQNENNAIFGGLTSAGSAATGIKFAHGGMVHKYATGGPVMGPTLSAPMGGPQSFAGQWLNSNVDMGSAPMAQGAVSIPEFDDGGLSGGAQKLGKSLNSAMKSSPGAPPKEYGDHGVTSIESEGMERGGKVKAQSKDQMAVKDGDSYDNDKVPALLSEGEVVLDLDTLKDKGPIGKMARALAAHLKKRNEKK